MRWLQSTAIASSLTLVVLLLLACSRAPQAGREAGHEPLEIDDQAGAVCGMFVRDQPAPRGQVLHRDGTRLFLCSLGDLLVHLEVPSPHGASERVFVEVMSPEEDPLELRSGAHPWLDASAASYVVGVQRRSIMGPPVLAYADSTSAGKVAAKHAGAEVLDFDALKQWWAKR